MTFLYAFLKTLSSPGPTVSLLKKYSCIRCVIIKEKSRAEPAIITSAYQLSKKSRMNTMLPMPMCRIFRPTARSPFQSFSTTRKTMPM
jgi:hypothetical protein